MYRLSRTGHISATYDLLGLMATIWGSAHVDRVHRHVVLDSTALEGCSRLLSLRFFGSLEQVMSERVKERRE